MVLYKRQWAQRNSDKVRDANIRWARENRQTRTKILAQYRARKLHATPVWADQDKILEFYAEAKRLAEETGTEYEVDHIIPLQGKYVSGLHVPDNLQVLTAVANRQKSNKFMEV